MERLRIKLHPEDPLRGASPSPEAWGRAARQWGWDKGSSQLHSKPVYPIPELPLDVAFPTDIEKPFDPSMLG